MLLYVLKSDIEAIGNYHVYGAYEDPYEALANAVDLLAKDFATAEQAQDEYGFSGYVLSLVQTNAPAKDAPQVEIKWGQLPITKVMGL